MAEEGAAIAPALERGRRLRSLRRPGCARCGRSWYRSRRAAPRSAVRWRRGRPNRWAGERRHAPSGPRRKYFPCSKLANSSPAGPCAKLSTAPARRPWLKKIQVAARSVERATPAAEADQAVGHAEQAQLHLEGGAATSCQPRPPSVERRRCRPPTDGSLVAKRDCRRRDPQRSRSGSGGRRGRSAASSRRHRRFAPGCNTPAPARKGHRPPCGSNQSLLGVVTRGFSERRDQVRPSSALR